LDGFCEVGDSEVLGELKIRDGAGHFEDAVVYACGQALLLHGALQQPLGVGVQLATGADLARGHLRVGIDSFAGPLEALALAFARGSIPESLRSRNFPFNTRIHASARDEGATVADTVPTTGLNGLISA
jgi:hypothetical protein